MKKNYIARRRGTSVAAAALSFALVAPLAQPVAFAQEDKPAAESAQNSDAPKPPAETPASNVEAYADAIHSPGEADQKGTISGSVKEIVETAVGFGNVQDSGKALKGVKVYAQWYEGVNTEHASPVYYTESDENGNFTINMSPYVDANGVTRTFRANATVGAGAGSERDHAREKIRVWAELPEDLAGKYRLVHQPAAGVFPDTLITPNAQGDGQWTGNRVKGVTIQYAQKTQLPQHLPQNKWAESQGSGLAGYYGGNAFWNLRVAQGALNHATVSKKDGNDVPAAGLQVVGSYLSDEAVKAIHEHVEKNFSGKTLRGKGWTVDDEQGLQRWINEQVAADPEGWIAETVKTTTDAKGDFRLYWKGLWGNSWESTPGGLTPPADKLHTLADSHDQGSWTAGNRSSKHINTNWSYVQILDKDGNVLPDNVGTLYPWSLGHWDGPNAGTSAQVFGGDGTLISTSQSAYGNWNIALYPAPLKFDVLEKNTYDNWARVGETVETLTTGLPIGEGLEYFIEWTDKDGNAVGSCGPVMPDADTTIKSCPLTVPADVEHGDTFTARLYQGKDNSGTVLAQDAFAVTTSYLAYEPADATVDTATVSKPKFDDPDTTPVEEKLESAEFFLNEDKLPEGVTADQVKVDLKTGEVTFTPKAGQEGKSFDIPVKMVDTAIQVPVYDENGNPVKDDEGNQVTRPRTIFHAPAKFNVALTPVADTVEPKYGNELVVPGKETKSTPSFTDKDGKGVDVPEGSKFKITDGFTAPEGYVVKIDETTGEITVTVDGVNKDTAEKFEVPVTVTYKDGSTDEVKAPFYLDTDGDGKPDLDEGIKDEDGNVVVEGDDDDDNDGVSDEDEKNQGTDPKDADSTPVPDPSLKPGDNTTVPADGGEHTVGKVENPNGDEGSKLVDKDGKEIPGSKVEIDEDGNVKVTVPEGTDPQDAKVIVTDKDGNPIGEIDVNIVDSRSDASINVPDYGDRKNVEAGKTEKSDPFEGKTDVPVKEATGKPSAGSEDWTFKTGETNGVVEATAPGYDKVADKIKSELPNIDSSWEKFKEIFTPYVRPSVDVDFEYNDGSKNSATADFDLVGKDGKSLLDPDGDFDGDGISNKDEIEGGTNPAVADEGDNTDTTAPLINPVKPGDRRITGKGDRPGEDITVTIPGVKDPIRTTTDKDGNWSVDVPTDIDLKPADRIRVADGAGNTTETTVEPAAPEPPLTDQFDPVYPRAYVRVGESATSVTPNLTRYINGREFRRQPLRTAGNVTFKVESPGTLKDNGRVEVSAPKDAQPGDLITVPVLVTYEDGTTDTTEAIFEVIPGAYAEMYDPKYEVGRSASPGEQTQVKQVGDNDLPEGTTFTLDRDKSDLNGWGIQVDEATGLITATAPQSRERRAEVVVTVSYVDGSQQSIVAFVDPQAATSMAETIPVKDALVTVPVGVALDANVVPALPDGTTFDIGAFSDENWSVDVNKDTGEVTVVTTDKVQPNDRVVVPVVVKFPDGSETTVNVTVVATKPQTTQHQPVYVASKVAPGERTSLQLEVPLDKKVGATYSLAGNAAGLKAEIDPETGVITVQADAGAKPGTRVLPVDVRYADGSVERIQARVEVTGTGVTANPACDDGSSNSSTSSTSSESCNTGSSTGGVIAIILGVLAVIGGAAWAAFINQDAVRDVLRNFGIKF